MYRRYLGFLCCIARSSGNVFEVAVILESTSKSDYLTNPLQMHWSYGCRRNCTLPCWNAVWNIYLPNKTEGDVGVEALYVAYQLRRIKASCLLQLRLGASARKKRFSFTNPTRKSKLFRAFLWQWCWTKFNPAIRSLHFHGKLCLAQGPYSFEYCPSFTSPEQIESQRLCQYSWRTRKPLYWFWHKSKVISLCC